MYQYVFFDLDGTLTDSQEGVLECVRYAIEAMGRPLPEGQDLLKFIGPPLQDSFMRYCGFSCEGRILDDTYSSNRRVNSGIFSSLSESPTA